jgi:succinyl-diaminopimelate desuccinylase
VSAVELARTLVRTDTVNPPGNEAEAARLIAARLELAGIEHELHALGPGREGLVARLPGSDADAPALCFSGHLDTVALGAAAWERDPLGGDVFGERLWGRGSSDMKGAVAAMVVAFEALARRPRRRPLALALCAGEEGGCEGAAQLAPPLGDVGALVIGESTRNRVAVAHKGVLWMRLRARGRAAHAAMPHDGENAIRKMVEAIRALDGVELGEHSHPHLGGPTMNVGTIRGGAMTNIVPDRCEATLDVRLVPSLAPEDALAAVRAAVGDDVEVELELALPAVSSDPDGAWLRSVVREAAAVEAAPADPIGVSYFTDASVLTPALGNPPTVIVGPGDPGVVHQVDEWCSIPAIERAQLLYERLGAAWGEN